MAMIDVIRFYFLKIFDIYRSKVKYTVYRFLQIVFTIDLLLPFVSCFMNGYDNSFKPLSIVENYFLFLWDYCLILVPLHFLLLVGITYAEQMLYIKQKYEEIENKKQKIRDQIESVNANNMKVDSAEIFSKIYEKNINTDNSSSFFIQPIEPVEVMLKSDEHYKFIDDQFKYMVDYMKEELKNSTLPNTSPIVEKIYEKGMYIEDLIDIIDKNIKVVPNGKYNIREFRRACNTETLFKPIINHMNSIKYPYENVCNLRNIMEQYQSDYKRLKKGDDGEAKVSEHLSLYNDRLINLANIRFEIEETTVEADNIVICENGVFCIETKNYGAEGETIEISKDGRWRRFRDDYELEIKNISEQHNRHIGIMQRLVNKELQTKGIDIPYVDFQPIFVIANDGVDIDNQSNELVVLRTSSIYPYIAKQKADNKLSKDVQEAIKDIILDHKKALKEYPVKDYRSAFKYNFDCLIMHMENLYFISKLYDDFIDELSSRGKKLTIRTFSNNNYLALEDN